MKYKKYIWIFVYVLFAGLFLYGGGRLISYYFDAYKTKLEARALSDEVVVWKAEAEEETAEGGNRSVPKKKTPGAIILGGTVPEAVVSEDTIQEVIIPESINFDALLEINSDVVAWVYCPGTFINYPIVKGQDNDTYLHRNLKKEYSKDGTLFVEARNHGDFSDFNTIIYGHNMKSGTMFQAITKYKAQSFYEKHPKMYLYTPECKYEVSVLAGCVIDADADIYRYLEDSLELQEEIKRMCEKSTFTSEETTGELGKIVTLSTCSYEYEDARYVIIGKMTEFD